MSEQLRTVKFDDLLANFGKEVALAKAIRSPNPEDTLNIKVAIAGFSHAAPIDEWSREHFEFVQARLPVEFPEDPVETYGPGGEKVVTFYALCIGYVVGLYFKGKLEERE